MESFLLELQFATFFITISSVYVSCLARRLDEDNNRRLDKLKREMDAQRKEKFGPDESPR